MKPNVELCARPKCTFLLRVGWLFLRGELHSTIPFHPAVFEFSTYSIAFLFFIVWLHRVLLLARLRTTAQILETAERLRHRNRNNLKPRLAMIFSLNPSSLEILLLENVRFNKNETKNDLDFAKELSRACDVYVNDAFSCSHREHSSLHAITNFLPSFSGLLLDEEIKALTSVLNSPKKPVAALIGGAKISTKINIIENLLTKMDYLIIGGAMANTFLVAEGLNVGKSLFEKDSVNIAKSIIKQSKKHKCNIILPTDLVLSKTFKKNADFVISSSNMVAPDLMALDIGPESINKINSIFKNIKTLLWNGPLGAFEIDPFGKGTFILAKEAADLTKSGHLLTVAGGGDTSSALNKAGVVDDFTYVSSAGGAFLEWLEGIELPAISVLGNNKLI